MSIFKFDEKEVFVNSLRLYPKYEFVAYSGTLYINNQKADSGSFNSQSLNVPSGFISLYEINNDKLSGSNNFIYPFITKDGSLQSFATVSTTQFAQSFAYGDVITGSYPMSSSLYRNYYPQLNTSAQYNITKHENGSFDQRPHIIGLRNTLDYYKTLSPHYAFTASHGTFSWDKAEQEMNLISIPSIF